MKKGTIKLLFAIQLILFFSGTNAQENVETDTVFEHLSVLQCDSLIQANTTNPKFIIVDVRRPEEYNPEHLHAAVNRDYFDENFTNLLNELNRNRSYLLYCLSGGRSGNTLELMQDMEFVEVYNMLGGINAWNGASLSTTADFAPQLMLFSDSMVSHDTIIIGEEQEIEITLTNRGNATLEFSAMDWHGGNEFLTDFNQSTSIEEISEYTFSIFYEPIDEFPDSVQINIESNGGTLEFGFWRTGQLPEKVDLISREEMVLFPNPASNKIYIRNNSKSGQIKIYDLFGNVLLEENAGCEAINIVDLSAGTYWIQVKSNKGLSFSKMFIKK